MALLIAGPSLTLAGCELAMPWGVDTVYEIENIDRTAQRRLARELRAQGFGFAEVDASGRAVADASGVAEPLDPELGSHEDFEERVSGYAGKILPGVENGGGSTFRFKLRGVRSMQDLRVVQTTIQTVSRRARIPVVLQNATMRFSSVSGGGSAKIWADGTATKGAEVILDVGRSEVRAVVDATGRWTAAVQRSSSLRERGGWIYVMIRKGNAKRYLRMNVLDIDRSEPLLYEQLPPDCSLRRY